MPEETNEIETNDDLATDDVEVEETEDIEVEEVEEEEVFTRKDIDKVQGALAKEREINKEKTAEVKAKNAEIRELKAELKKSLDSKLEDDGVKNTLAEAERRAVKFRDIAVNKEAALALTEAGAKVSTKRLIKLLDLQDVDIDDSGNVSGLADAIAELKEESPEFFKSEELEEEEIKPKRAAVKRAGSADGGNKTPPQPKQPSTAELFAKMAMGKIKP